MSYWLHTVLTDLVSQIGGGLAAPAHPRAVGVAWRGVFGNVELTLTYVDGRDHRLADVQTLIEIDIPPGYPLSLHVCKHELFDRARIKRGTMVDVTVGDPDFDALFRVEAAPADVVARLIGPKLRAFMVSRPDTLLLTLAASSTVRLALVGWSNIEVAMQAIDSFREFGEFFSDAYQAADAAIIVPETVVPYRDSFLDDSPRLAAHAQRQLEVARVEAMLQQRRHSKNKILAGIVTVVLAILTAWRLL